MSDESEPFYEGDGEFRVELPDDPHGCVGDVADHEQFDAVLDELVEGVERELRPEFGFKDGDRRSD